MKKNVKYFLNFLEKETSITFDLSTISPTQKLRNSINQPVLINVLAINEGTLGLAVISCGCKSCNEIIGVEILWREHGMELCDALNVQYQIKTAVPTISVELRNAKELE